MKKREYSSGPGFEPGSCIGGHSGNVASTSNSQQVHKKATIEASIGLGHTVDITASTQIGLQDSISPVSSLIGLCNPLGVTTLPMIVLQAAENDPTTLVSTGQQDSESAVASALLIGEDSTEKSSQDTEKYQTYMKVLESGILSTIFNTKSVQDLPNFSNFQQKLWYKEKAANQAPLLKKINSFYGLAVPKLKQGELPWRCFSHQLIDGKKIQGKNFTEIFIHYCVLIVLLGPSKFLQMVEGSEEIDAFDCVYACDMIICLLAHNHELLVRKDYKLEGTEMKSIQEDFKKIIIWTSGVYYAICECLEKDKTTYEKALFVMAKYIHEKTNCTLKDEEKFTAVRNVLTAFGFMAENIPRDIIGFEQA